MSGCLHYVFKFFVLTWFCLMFWGNFGSFSVAQEPRSAGEVKRIVTDVLSDPEYRHLRRAASEGQSPDESELPEWFKSFLDWLFQSENSSPSTESSLDLGGLFFYGSLGLLIIILIMFVVLAWRNSEAKNELSPFEDDADEEAINPSKPAGELPTNEYVKRAMVAAESGDFRAAIRELVLGSMSWTERVGLIRHRRGLTNRDYIRAVWRDEQRRGSLLHIVSDFERVFYGHRLADQDTFEACLTEFQKSFLLEVRDVQPTS